MNVSNILEIHTHYDNRAGWRKVILVALAFVDEFFAGRFQRICDTRTILENRWGDFI